MFEKPEFFKKTVYIIFLTFLYLACEPLYSITLRKKKLIEDTQLRLFGESRMEILSEKINKEKDKYGNMINLNLNLYLNNILSKKTSINFINKMDAFVSRLTDYGLNEYDLNFLFNTFSISYLYTLSKKTFFDFAYTNEFFKDKISPYDDNFDNISLFLLQDSFLHQLKDSVLSYNMPATFNIHNKYYLDYKDIVFEYLKHKIKFSVEHYITPENKVKFDGELYDKDYNYNDLNDFYYTNFNISYKKPLKTEKLAKPKIYDKLNLDTVTRADLLYLGYKYVIDAFKTPKPSNSSIYALSNDVELSYSNTLKEIKSSIYGDYLDHTLTASLSQILSNKLQLNISNAFSYREYRPEGYFYENYRQNNFNTYISYYPDTKSLLSLDLSFLAADHPHFPLADYNQKTAGLTLSYKILNNTTFQIRPTATWFSYKDPEQFGQSYYNGACALTLTARLNKWANFVLGYEYQVFDYKKQSISYKNYVLNSYAITFSSNIAPFTEKLKFNGVDYEIYLEGGLKRENIDYTDYPEYDRDTFITFLALKSKFF